jgi:putative flippase GtrA
MRSVIYRFRRHDLSTLVAGSTEREDSEMTVKSVFIEALKFGISGIFGALISGSIYYTYHGAIPLLIRVVRGHPINLAETSFYIATSIAGGTVHFTLSKVWVFVKKKPSA